MFDNHFQRTRPNSGPRINGVVLGGSRRSDERNSRPGWQVPRFEAYNGVKDPISQVGGARDGRGSQSSVFGRVRSTRVSLVVFSFWILGGVLRLYVVICPMRVCLWDGS